MPRRSEPIRPLNSDDASNSQQFVHLPCHSLSTAVIVAVFSVCNDSTKASRSRSIIMFPTFTGSSRPRRQVNLSGRNSNNPFAATQQTSNARSSPSAVALAQQERKARQQERERLQATKIIQKSWRGHSCRRYLRDKARQEWDEQERILGALPGKQSPEQLRLLLRFATPRQEGDLERVSRYAVTFDRFLRDPSSSLLDREWDLPLNKLCKLCLSMISHLLDDSHAEIKHVEDSDQAVDNMLMMVAHIGGIYPHEVSRYADTYYLTLRKLLLSPRSMPEPRLQRISQLLTQPLKQESYGSASLYRAFLVDFLTLPNIQDRINLTDVARDIKPRLLAKVLRIEVSSNTPAKLTRTLPNESLLWLLAYFIFLCRTSAAYSSTEPFLDIDYVASVSALLSDLADDLGQRPSLSDTTSDASLPKFIEQEVTGLINKSSITSLLVQSAILPASTDMQHQNSDSAAILASYALTLLQVFPRRGDEIRMWLYLGSTSSQPNSSGETEKTPAIRYFWDAVSKTTIFTSICTKPRNAVKLLGNGQGQSAHDPVRKVGQEWRVILLFLELYTFVLKFMDDEEFMNGANLIGSDKSWTRHSALELTQVRDLTMFLKNLAFAMYWHSAEITGAEEPASTGSLASYFGHGMPAHADDLDESDKHKDINIAGINGITLSYTKGMVTGLLRMIYERE